MIGIHCFLIWPLIYLILLYYLLNCSRLESREDDADIDTTIQSKRAKSLRKAQSRTKRTEQDFQSLKVRLSLFLYIIIIHKPVLF
jgi:hypothetical protein